MNAKVNLAEKLALLDAPFHAGVVASFNDNKLAVVKVLGEFVWHRHENTDDLFVVLSGRLNARRARHTAAPAYAIDSRRTTTSSSDA